MASPQLEDGFVAIAYDLYVALASSALSGLEKEIMLAVIYFTYGNSKTKAAIDDDDIQNFLSGDRRIRADRITSGVKSLLKKDVLFEQHVNQHTRLLGVQKDFERWGTLRESGQNDSLLRSSNIYSLRSKRDKLSTLQEYAYLNSDFKLGHKSWAKERKTALHLFRQALELTGDPKEAYFSIKDFIDSLRDREFYKTMRFRFQWMKPRFKAWYKTIPAKPRSGSRSR